MIGSHRYAALDVTIVGGGMITDEQVLPAMYQSQREGRVGSIAVCALDTPPLKALAENPALAEAFPSQKFTSYPALSESEDRKFPALYKEAIALMPKRQLVFVAMPDALHYEVVMAALEADQNIVCVKPLVLSYEHSESIRKAAWEKGLYVGVEYHKRFDRRALIARRQYRAGNLGAFAMGEAKMIEPYYYRDSNFQNWFVPEKTDPFAYVGCHYVDLVWFITGLRPTELSVNGVLGKFPNGNDGYMWTNARVSYENGAILSVINGLGYPDAASGSNIQGLIMYCEGEGRNALVEHDDQFRGATHCYLDGMGIAGTRYQNIHPDFVRLVPWNGPGLRAAGYGVESIQAHIDAVAEIENKSASLSGTDSLRLRREMLAEIDERGILATPANSAPNSLVAEAGRRSILEDGRRMSITYGEKPEIQARA